MFVLMFVFVGMTQSIRVTLWMVPPAVVAFLLGCAGTPDTDIYANFAVTLMVATVVGVLLSVFVDRSIASSEWVDDLLDVSHALIRSDSIVETAMLLEGSANRLLAADLVFTFLAEYVGSTRFVTVLPSAAGLPAQVSIDVAQEHSGIGTVLERGEVLFVPDTHDDTVLSARMKELVGCASVMLVPLAPEGVGIGVVAFCWRDPVRAPAPDQLRAVSLFAAEAGFVFERQLAMEQVESDAATDPLTGLLNRRAIERRLELLSSGDAVILIDLDRFKQINDVLGHAVGDAVLQSFSDCLRATVRHDDWCARLGGDEFLLVLRGGGDGGTRGVLADLQQAWRSSGPATTFSAGAAIVSSGEGAAEATARADGALYRAKGRGRDRTEVALGV
jgi:diguanylate cyclase (GGDEF)-like protein